MDTKLLLKGRGVQLLLFGVEVGNGTLFAQGFQAETYLRKNRILKDELGQRYRLPQGLEPKEGIVQVVPLSLEQAIQLEVM